MGRRVQILETDKGLSVKIWHEYGSTRNTPVYSSSCEASYQPVIESWFIDSLHVHWKFRDQGMGGDLMETMKRAIRKAGGTKIMLSAAGATLEKQKRLRRFYEEHGFNMVTRVGSESLLMEFHFES